MVLVILNLGATLFVNRSWIIVPHKENNSSGIESIKELVLFLGSKPICLEAKVHDQQVALISHVPSILSKSYLDFVNSIDPESLIISGPGFQTFTRLAHDNNEMSGEIAKYNQQVIHDYLDRWLEFLRKNRGPQHQLQ
jgi:prephenate dehydrogenase